MSIVILIIGIAFIFASFHFHAISQANMIEKVEREWFERLFTGSRASKDNLNEDGLRSRKQSNICLVGGLLTIGCYLYFF